MMEFFRRAPGSPRHLGVLPGTFNPPTVAHLALAEAALTRVDEVLFILPRQFPHKIYSGASFDTRVDMLSQSLDTQSPFSIAGTDKGLFVEIAAECREAYGPDVRLSFLCGRDAAERIANWDYGRPGAFAEMLADFDLWVAARAGEYTPPKGLEHRCLPLPLSGPFDHVSASEVRNRIAAGEAWEHLVPPAIRTQVCEIFMPGKIR
jgi:nicotinate-nucleotide adenylyltransferase